MFVRSATHLPFRKTEENDHVIVRVAELSDCGQLATIQASCYRPDLHEEPNVFDSIVRCGTSYVACIGSSVVGYLLAHPWDILDSPPPLNTLLDPSGPCTFVHVCTFVHDLAVLPGWRGTALASRLFGCLDRSRPMSLVSVQGSKGFWEKQGFVKQCCKADLESYGPGAVYMVREPTSGTPP